MTEFPYKARTISGADVTVLAEDGDYAFIRADNGTHRIYSIDSLTPLPTPDSIAKEAAERFLGIGRGNPREYEAALAAVILEAATEIARLT